MIKQQEKSETHFFHLNKWNLLQNSSGNKIQTHTNRFPFEQTKAEASRTIYENIAKSKKKIIYSKTAPKEQLMQK